MVAELMREHDCGVIPVCEFEKVVGVITERDITFRAVALGMSAAEVPVKNVMTTTPAYTVRQEPRRRRWPYALK